MSIDNGYRVQEISPADVSDFYEKLKARTLPLQDMPIHERPFLGRPTPEHQKGIVVDGFFIRGRFGITLRNAKTGEVEWEHEQDNLMTDIARYQFADGGFVNMQIGFMPSKEAPAVARVSVGTDSSQCFTSGGPLGSSITPSTFTRQFSYNFSTPPSANRTLGSVMWMYYGHGINSAWGPDYIAAYALLTPPKTQTTLQTLEVVYKISMNPVY
jgi:hypothetical protein